MWESKEIKGQRQKKSRVDPQLELNSTAVKKIDLTIEEVADDMKLSKWRAMQWIKHEQLLVSVLSRVVAKELSLEEMVTEFNKYCQFLLPTFCHLIYTVLMCHIDFTTTRYI